MLFFHRVESADAGTDKHADFVAIDLVQVQTGILERLVARIDAELREAVGPANFFGGRKSRRRIKILHLGGYLAIVVGNVEGCDLVDAAAPGDEVGPERVDVVAERGYDAQSRY